MQYRVSFEGNKIGRATDVAPLEVETDDLLELANKILAYVRRSLISSNVWLDADQFGGDVWAGYRRVAHFTIETAEGASV